MQDTLEIATLLMRRDRQRVSLTHSLNYFEFTYSYHQLQKQNAFRDHCHNYNRTMGDIDAEELKMELDRFTNIVLHNKNLHRAKDFLNHIYEKELQELYPNLAIALRVLLSTPVTVASAERSFSRLKLIKNFLRSTTSDDRLSNLGIIAIENAVARTLDYEDLVKQFAEAKARKKPFQ